ncbi:MAG: hypothetical protein ABSC22_19350 [Roseiarcus sp.]|jgi:hypothetical protein
MRGILRFVVMILALGAVAAGGFAAALIVVGPPRAESPAPAPSPTAKTAPVAERADTSPQTPQAAATPAQAEASPAGPIGQQLIRAGATACGEKLGAMAKPALAGAAQAAPLSVWAQSEPDRRLASIVVGENYGPQARAPFALTGLVGAPHGETACDGFFFQVIASPLPCEQIGATIRARGEMTGALAGLPLFHDVNGRTALMPSAGNGCVLVNFRSEYADPPK